MGPRTERRVGQRTFLSFQTILLETMFISAEIASHYMQGRHGKGSIFVFAAGNGGVIGDSCAFSGYVNSIYTIAISGVNWDGSVPAYTEQCAGIMAVTYGQEMFTDGKVKPPMVRSQYRPVFITQESITPESICLFLDFLFAKFAVFNCYNRVSLLDFESSRFTSHCMRLLGLIKISPKTRLFSQ